MKITPELQTILDYLDYGWRVYFFNGLPPKAFFDSYEVLPDTLILKSSLDPSIHTCLGNLIESNDLFFRIEQKDSWSNAVLQFNWENPKLMKSIGWLEKTLIETMDQLDTLQNKIENKWGYEEEQRNRC